MRFCPQSGNILVCIGGGGRRGHDKFFNLPDDILLPVKLSEDETFKVLLKELLELEEELAMRGRQALVVLCEILVIEEPNHKVLGVPLTIKAEQIRQLLELIQCCMLISSLSIFVIKEVREIDVLDSTFIKRLLHCINDNRVIADEDETYSILKEDISELNDLLEL